MRILLSIFLALIGGVLWGFISHLFIGIPAITGLGLIGLACVIFFINKKNDDEA